MTAPARTDAQRRALARQARDAFPPMGVYLVRDGGSGRWRVEACRDVHARINRERFELRMGSHPDRELLAAWRQDPQRIEFRVLEMVRERTDPEFDYQEELQLLAQLHREQLAAADQAAG